MVFYSYPIHFQLKKAARYSKRFGDSIDFIVAMCCCWTRFSMKHVCLTKSAGLGKLFEIFTWFFKYYLSIEYFNSILNFIKIGVNLVILSVVPLFKGQDDEFGIIWLAIQKPLLFLDPLVCCIDFLFEDVLYHKLLSMKIWGKSMKF